MKICAICGENYEDRYSRCPCCGCPGDRYNVADSGFPEALNRRYIPAGWKRGSGGRKYLILVSKRTGKKILAGKVSVREQNIRKLVEFQMREKLPELPLVYEVSEEASEFVFLFEYVNGRTLKEMAEREYPLDEGLIARASELSVRVSKHLEDRGCPSGRTDWNSFAVSDGTIRMADFGGGEDSDGDRNFLSERTTQLERGREEITFRHIFRQNISLLFLNGALVSILIMELFIYLYLQM